MPVAAVGSARSAGKIGFWSAVLSSFFSIAYVVAQLFEWAGMLGSAGGPESMSTPFGTAVLLTPSLFLGSAFLVLMVSVHRWTPPERKVWSQIGLAFATAYAVLISLVYYVQLTFVVPRLAAGDVEGAAIVVSYAVSGPPDRGYGRQVRGIVRSLQLTSPVTRLPPGCG